MNLRFYLCEKKNKRIRNFLLILRLVNDPRNRNLHGNGYSPCITCLEIRIVT